MMRKRILVVDDDSVLRAGLGQILSSHQYRVETAGSGFEALEQIPSFQPDLIITDTSMPGMDGLEFYGRVRATSEGKSVAFIFLTAPADVLPSLPDLDKPDVLAKPFGPETLLVAVQSQFRKIAEAQGVQPVTLSSLSPELLSPFFHEFRTSLTMVKTCIALLTNPHISYDPAELSEFLDIVRRGGDRIDRLVRDFLTILKLESGVAEREALDADKVDDLDGAIRSVVQLLQHDIAERNVSVQVDVAEDTPALPVNDEHLMLIIEKLLQNAIKFSKETGGQISIRVSPEEESVRFDVIDQGLGIPREEQDQIFDRFYQLVRAGLERQGAGLGLAVVKGLVELYNGSIQVESEVDRGSTFSFVLPTTPQVRTTLPQEPPSPEPPAAEASPEDEDTPLTAEEAFRRLGITFEGEEE